MLVESWVCFFMGKTGTGGAIDESDLLFSRQSALSVRREWEGNQMTRVISCRVIDPASRGDGDVQTALAPLAGDERFFRRRILPTVDYYSRLPDRWRGCVSDFGPESYNAAVDIPAGLLVDVLA